jgi:hypothetical protein
MKFASNSALFDINIGFSGNFIVNFALFPNCLLMRKKPYILKLFVKIKNVFYANIYHSPFSI